MSEPEAKARALFVGAVVLVFMTIDMARSGYAELARMAAWPAAIWVWMYLRAAGVLR